MESFDVELANQSVAVVVVVLLKAAVLLQGAVLVPVECEHEIALLYSRHPITFSGVMIFDVRGVRAGKTSTATASEFVVLAVGREMSEVPSSSFL